VPAIRLRPFLRSDYHELLTWFRSARELELFAGPDVAWPLTADQLSRWHEDPQIRAWSAFRPADTESLLGHVELVQIGSAGGRLARVAVEPDSRGRGYGRQLVAAALERARSLGFDWVELNVAPDNERAVRLYASLGFEEIAQPQLRPEVKRMSRSLVG
jgi:ribosomal protein S18 acetylase RimI-like enzyme